MNVQVVRRLLGLGVLLAVMGGVSPLDQVESVWAQEVGEQQKQSGSATDASAEGLLQAAGTLLQKGDIPGALQLLELALKRYQAEENRVGEMRVLAKMGEAYKQQKSYEEAIAAFKEALGIASQGDNLNNVGWLQNQIGIAHFRLKQYEEAAAAQEQAVVAYQGAQNTATAAQVFQNLGQNYEKLEQHQKSLDRYLTALSLYAQLKNQPKTAAILRSIGVSYRNLEKPQEAVQALEKSVEIWESLKNYAEVRESLKQLALVRRGLLQQTDLADALFERALATFELEENELGSEERAQQLQAQKMQLLISWGQAHWKIHDSLHALELIEKGWKLRQSLPEDLPSRFSSLNSATYTYIAALDDTGNFIASQAKHQESLDYFKEAHRLAQTLVVDQNISEAKIKQTLLEKEFSIGSAHYSLKNYQKAIKKYSLILREVEENKSLEDSFSSNRFARYLMDSYNSWGEVLLEERNFEKALQKKTKAYDFVAKTGDRAYEIFMLIEISEVYRGKQEFRRVISLMEEALKVSEEIGGSRFDLGARLTLARMHYELDEYPQAIENFNLALRDSYVTSTPRIKAQILAEVANTFSNQGEHERAYELKQQHLNLVRAAQLIYQKPITKENYEEACQFPERFGQGNTLESISLFCNNSIYDKLGHDLQQRLDTIQNNRSSTLRGLQEHEAEAMNSSAISLDSLGRSREAVELLKNAIKISKSLDDWHSTSLYKQNLSKIYFSLGEAESSVSSLQESLQISKEIDDLSLIRENLNQLAFFHLDQGNIKKAIDLSSEALDLAEKLGIASARAASLGALSSIYYRAGDIETAMRYATEALAIYQDIGMQDNISIYLSSLAVMHRDQGNLEKAIELNEQALEIAENFDGPVRTADALFFQAVFRTDMAEYGKVYKDYQRIIEIYRKIGNKSAEVSTLSRIGRLHAFLGQYKKAESTFRQALAIAEGTGSRKDLSNIQQRIAESFTQQQRYGEALEIYQISLVEARDRQLLPNEMNSLKGIGTIQRQQKQWAKAEATLTQALDIAQTTGRRIDQAALLSELGRTQLGQGKTDTAEATLTQALALAQNIRDPQRQAEILSDLGELYTPESPEMAIALYKQSVNTYETIRSGLLNLDQNTQQSYTNTIADTYRALASLLLEQGRTVEALTVLDLLKVQELQDFLKNVRGQSRLTSGVELLPEEQQILETFKTLITQQTPTEILGNPALQTQLKMLSDTAVPQNLRLKAYEDLQTRLKSLGQNSALLYPLILEDRVELVIFTPDRSPIRQPVPIAQTDLQAKIQTFTDAIANPYSNIQPIAQDLYQLLIEPIDAELQAANIQTLIYAPDGQMRYVPLAALHDGKQWLGQRYQLNYLTALALTPLDAASTAEPKVLAGAVTQPHTVSVFGKDYAFSGLGYTQPEVESVANRLQNTTQLVDSNLNRQQLQNQMPHHSIVHLATHAKFTPGTPEDSFILLGDGKTISLREIQDWKLPNVELMVLSACETALGERLGSGLEILGFGYQMQRTGSRAAIASLWSIDDGGTQIFMNAFYAGLSQGMSKVEAVQAAQQALITNDYTKLGINPRASLGQGAQAPGLPTETQLNHPYYWAPFILIGNGL